MAGRIGVAGMLLGAVLLAGCASASMPSDPEIAYFGEESHGGDSAALVGVLDRVDGCTVLHTEEQGDWVPVFSPGTAQWRGDTLRLNGINTPESQPRTGDEITLGGGISQGGANESWVVPAGCASFTQFWRVASD